MDLINRLRFRLGRLLVPSLVGSSRVSEMMSAANPGEDIPGQLRRLKQESDSVYAILYQQAHDNEQAAPFASQSTVSAFGHQWANLPEGAFMLSDPWFREHVDDIISREELQIDRSWFKGRKVVDAGCGGGRWSYGLAKLGCRVTAVDVNESAIAATRKALAMLGAEGQFVHSEIEEVGSRLEPESFDLVWSWGVLHHCRSFNRALRAAAGLVKPGGVIHLYLYGRNSIPLDDDVQLFKKRTRYNFLFTDEQRMDFLREMAAGHGLDVHHVHDIYAPLINRRFTYTEVADMLRGLGFGHVEQTIVHSEVWIRGVKADSPAPLDGYLLPKAAAPYWFQRDALKQA